MAFGRQVTQWRVRIDICNDNGVCKICYVCDAEYNRFFLCLRYIIDPGLYPRIIYRTLEKYRTLPIEHLDNIEPLGNI